MNVFEIEKWLENNNKIAQTTKRNEYFKIKRLKQKFQKLKSQQISRYDHIHNFNKENLVINLSSKTFTNDEIDVLEKGFKYKIKPQPQFSTT